MTSILVLLVLLAQPHDEDEDDVADSALWEVPQPVHLIGTVRLAGLGWGPVDALAGFVHVEPGVVVDGADRFGLNVGAPLRQPLRLSGGNGTVRHEDWDELSDFGQILRSFRVGRGADALRVSAGAFGDYTHLSGHLVSRYDNRLNPDYHPAGLWVKGQAGPLRVDAFASDILAARLFAGELMVAPFGLVGAADAERIHLSVSIAHDASLGLGAEHVW